MKGNKDQNAKQTDCILVEKTSGIDLSCQYNPKLSVAHRPMRKSLSMFTHGHLLRLDLNRQAAPNKGSRPQPRREIVAVEERRKIRLEPGPHCLSPELAVVPD